MKLSKNILYMLMQGLFWMAYCASYGFVSYYLVSSGFGTSVVGVVSMISGLASALLQPYVGSIADRAGVGYRKPLRIVLAALAVMSAALFAFSAAQLESAVILSYGVIMLLLGTGVPLLNTAGIAFPKEINFISIHNFI